jgi:ribulose-5-phosphate 4-epimerase/fuculose-1-phosphate aldolase
LFGELVKIGHILEKQGVSTHETGIMSYDYGRRLVITAKNIDVKQMSQEDIVEIADYDPLKNIMLVIGTKEPSQEAPVHWIVQKARHDINVLLQMHSPSLVKKLKGALPSTEEATPPGTLDRAKELLKTLRKGKTILIQDDEILFAGINLPEIEKSIAFYLKERA